MIMRSVLCLLLIGALPALPVQPELLRVEGSVDAMGTAFSIVAYGEDRGRLQSAVSQALEEARRLDHMLSNYMPASEWSMVNRDGGRPAGAGLGGAFSVACSLRGVQPRERRRIRYHGRSADEGLGIL